MVLDLSDHAGPLPGTVAARDGWPRARGLLAEPSAATRALEERLAASRARGGVVRAVVRDGEVQGAVALRESPFDAEGLGVRAVATVDVVALPRSGQAPPEVLDAIGAAIDAFSRERGARLDWIKVDASDAPLLEVLLRHGFRVVEPVLSLASDEPRLARPAATPPEVRVREAVPDDDAWLRALAERSFPESRFSDPAGPPGWNALVYRRWIDARLAQRSDDLAVLVALVEGERAGFLIWKVHATPGAPGRTGQVDLVATDPRARGRGVGRALLDAARTRSGPLAWVAADVYARNPPGLALHQRYGLLVSSAALCLHRWHPERP